MEQVTGDTGARFYDYAFDERFADRHEWFMNVDHLNEEGARNFTDILMEETVFNKSLSTQIQDPRNRDFSLFVIKSL